MVRLQERSPRVVSLFLPNLGVLSPQTQEWRPATASSARQDGNQRVISAVTQTSAKLKLKPGMRSS